MDMSKLAMKMLRWEEAKAHLERLTWDIQDAVLKLGETQTVGNVRATYLKGRVGQGDPSVVIEIV
jgi:hypothetical protein